MQYVKVVVRVVNTFGRGVIMSVRVEIMVYVKPFCSAEKP